MLERNERTYRSRSAQVGSHTNALAKYLTGQFDNHDVDVDILI